MLTGKYAGVVSLHSCAVTGGDTGKVQRLHLQESCQGREAALCCCTAAHFPVPCSTRSLLRGGTSEPRSLTPRGSAEFVPESMSERSISSDWTPMLLLKALLHDDPLTSRSKRTGSKGEL